MKDFTYRVHNEKNIDGFTSIDGTVKFYSFVRAIALQLSASRILDFGAGRGAALADGKSFLKRHLQDMRTTGADVTAADIDEIVRTHPASDHQVVLKIGERFPFDDEAFHLIVSDMTFEHIEDTQFIAKELTRILKPGGWICIRTPNRWGYVRFLSGLVPNRLHVSALKHIQPTRKSHDVFPAHYRMNSRRQIRSAFADFEVYQYNDSAEPSYHFGNAWIYQFFLILHRILPDGLATASCFFLRKSNEA